MLIWILAASAVFAPVPRANAQARVIEITADSDSRYKIAGQRTPEITVKAGEPDTSASDGAPR